MIKLFNTLTDKKEEFIPINAGKVLMYVCGMTVQNRPHLGHMRVYVMSDLIRRVFEYNGYNVKVVQNFTDIDDKVIERAREFNTDYRLLGEKYIKEYIESSVIMNIKPPYYYPKATQHIEEIIKLVDELIKRGYAYVVKGNVYYSTNKFKEYGKLSKKRIEDLISGSRVKINPDKKNPLDFVLWKMSKKGEPFWYSPWGKGRPGWHIECSAMSMKYLGETFDIHAGGSDLIFPHHENEIAQSEAVTGKIFANYWVHNEMLRIKGEKMSKSLSNFLAVKDILNRISPNSLRLYYLKTHFRSPLEYDDNSLNESSNAMNRVERFVEENYISENKSNMDLFEDIMNDLNDNFNTPKVLGTLFSILREANSGRGDKNEVAGTIKKVFEIMGFVFQKKERNNKIDGIMNLIIEIRKDLREKKCFQIADKIRYRLERHGIELKDGQDETKWNIR
ncbi:cysteine--tRNA ligase [candidate division TA06 bacterium]|uniref:Cysteine--tRNA ligase n=1 Tax=candidate division TA06 bacterium TaxID=2250710 RepID=A0A660SQU4_UNCT6|nr:MAG: cysteine--tRNA ligase [candidate division TA06 bacterium]